MSSASKVLSALPVEVDKTAPDLEISPPGKSHRDPSTTTSISMPTPPVLASTEHVNMQSPSSSASLPVVHVEQLQASARPIADTDISSSQVSGTHDPQPSQSTSPVSITLATSTSTTLVKHRFNKDRVIPSIGQLIKIKLQDPLNGPGSKLSSSAPSWATSQNYHSAVVTAVLGYQFGGLLISVFPIPSYSNAPDSVQWVRELPLSEFKKHIPMPCPSSRLPTTPTPKEFGTPINPVTTLINGHSETYIDRRPSWVLLDQQTFLLPPHTLWKSFSPDVVFPSTDLNRLQNYMVKLQAADLQVNMVTVPDLSTDMLEQIFGRMGGGSGIYALLSQGVHVLEDDGLEDEEDEDDCESECDPIEYYRMLPNRSPWMQRVIDEREQEEKLSREERILEWVDKGEDPNTNPT